MMASRLDEILGRDELRGFDRVRVAKDKLLEAIRKNRDEHRQIFEEALEGWKNQVTKDLEEAAEDARAGRAFRIRFNLIKPEDHTDDYDTVITMLEMSQDDEFEITVHEFNSYVMDKWGWQASFLRASSGYGSAKAFDKSSTLNMNLDE